MSKSIEKNNPDLKLSRKAPLATRTDLSPAATKDIAAAMNGILADVFALYMKTKNFHWHMSGPHFRDYHLLLDEQADQLYAMTDPIAERVRKVGGPTLKSIGHIARTQRVLDNDAEYVEPQDIPALAQPASERPKEGDLLVSIESESTNALEPKDIPLGGPPLLAWPMDTADKTVRKDSRLNKILLLRLDLSTLVGATKDRAAEGVVAYSAICPHAGCEVNVWAAEQQTLECSCHYSHYNPREGASVIDGPAPRALAALPQDRG